MDGTLYRSGEQFPLLARERRVPKQRALRGEHDAFVVVTVVMVVVAGQVANCAPLLSSCDDVTQSGSRVAFPADVMRVCHALLAGLQFTHNLTSNHDDDDDGQIEKPPRMLDTVHLLSFPKFSSGLSRYKNSTPTESFGSRRDSSSGSPPRKIPRTETPDEESKRLTRSMKGKAKESDVQDLDLESSVRKMVVKNPAGESLSSSAYVSS